jgi:hypothetical protein
MTIEDTCRHGDDLIDPPDEEHPTREQLMAQIREMEMDWRLLNLFLNRTADQYEWCSDYEERLRKYNEYFVVLALYDRESTKHDRGGGREGGYPLSDRKLEELRDRVRNLNQRRNPPPRPVSRPVYRPIDEFIDDGPSVGVFQQRNNDEMWEIR